MMIHPQYDPVALSLGPVEVHWYGLMYLLAFAAAYGLAWYRSTKRDNWTTDMVSDLVFYGALGVILGGRIARVAFDENVLELVDGFHVRTRLHGAELDVI